MENVCFTGHRNIFRSRVPRLKAKIIKILALLISQGITALYSCGARGFDLLVAEAAVELKEKGLPIKLIMILPHKVAKKRLPAVVSHADETVFLSERDRNKYIVQHSDICVVYMTHGGSNTKQIIRLAREYGLPVIDF